MGKATRWTVVVLALALYATGAFWFAAQTPIYRLFRSSGPAHVSYERALVTAVQAESLEKDEHGGLLTGYQDLAVRILTGPRAGAEVSIRNFLNYTTNFRLGPGSEIIAHVDTADADHSTVSVYTPDRSWAVYALALVFVAVLCGVGGWRGVRSLLGILFTFTSLLFVFIPLLYRGWSPVLAATVLTATIVCVSLLLLDGLKVKTVSAILGSLVGLGLSALLEALFQGATQTSGYASADADALLAISGQTGLKVGELLFAGVLVASMGAIMDVAISVASAVCEVRDSSPSLLPKNLFKSGMNVGRDMMGAMANTLILAFTGASLNTLILLYSLEHSFYQVLNSNAVVIEVGEALTASLAVMLTVPAVALFTAALSRKSRHRLP